MRMQALQRGRSVLLLKSTLSLSGKLGAEPAKPITHLVASFHSTNASCDKWKKKYNHDVSDNRKPSKKTNIKYIIRQRRADTKKALDSILFSGGCSPSRAESFSKIEASYANVANKKSRMKPAHESKRALRRKLQKQRCREREKSNEDFDDNSENIFRATFSKHGFHWKFKPLKNGFDWTKGSAWTDSRYDQQDAKSRTEYYDESFTIGTYADRKILGLPAAGPLKIEDVKAAFRLSAFKWHPDRHQAGSSQAAAEEKFKHCVNAYKSLCNALSTP